MSFIYYYHRSFLIIIYQHSQGLLKLALGIPPVETGFITQFVQGLPVKVARCQRGIGDIEHLVAVSIQSLAKAADGSGLAGPGIPGKDTEGTCPGHMIEPSVQFPADFCL